jgi:hypothetical protein
VSNLDDDDRELLAVYNEPTVRRARKSTAPDGAVEKRTGKDGRQRKLPTPKRFSVGKLLPTTLRPLRY